MSDESKKVKPKIATRPKTTSSLVALNKHNKKDKKK